MSHHSRRVGPLRLAAACSAGLAAAIAVGASGVSTAADNALKIPDLTSVCGGPIQVTQFLWSAEKTSWTPQEHVLRLIQNGVIAEGRGHTVVDDSQLGSQAGLVRVLDESDVVAVAAYVYHDEWGWVAQEVVECV